MRERAMLVGATLTIDTGPTRGTVVELSIPR
jgi:signal transduction histidine kinase